MKKLMLLVMAFTVFFAFSMPDTSDARRGGFKSPRKSYTQTPSKPADNVQKSQPNKQGATAGTTAQNRGFFSGGSLVKGLMIGGLAGLLFGGMFANMGGFGDFLGLLVNVLAIYFIIVAIRSAIRYFREKRRLDNQRRPY
ncbi:MAG TPA: hypothetical protein VMS09_01340 [Paenibacillus sp.]|uniref:hypothetical protein n=1 Tax=Paenibacillus sp. TaxID=58172 RepID=UPI0028D8180B|nr:hypothetical protein [Paenibacillus sp.]HUC90653.1 hypothetical protein [Paenibacillus sp.]